MSKRRDRRTRADDVLDCIIVYAEENAGVTPSSDEVAGMLELSQQRVSYLMMRLEIAGKIEWVTSKKYKVVDSVWEPPPEQVIRQLPLVGR